MVTVPLVAIILSVFVVVALVVEAFRVKKLPVVPQSVVIVAVIAFKIFAQRD